MWPRGEWWLARLAWLGRCWSRLNNRSIIEWFSPIGVFQGKHYVSNECCLCMFVFISLTYLSYHARKT